MDSKNKSMIINVQKNVNFLNINNFQGKNNANFGPEHHFMKSL